MVDALVMTIVADAAVQALLASSYGVAASDSDGCEQVEELIPSSLERPSNSACDGGSDRWAMLLKQAHQCSGKSLF